MTRAKDISKIVTDANLSGTLDVTGVSTLNSKVGILGTNDLGLGLHIKEGDSGVTSVSTDADQLVIENNAESGISILAPTNSASRIAFGDSDNNKIGMIYYNHSSNFMKFDVNNAERMRIPTSDSRSVLSIGDTTVYTGITSTTATSSSLISMNSGQGSEIVLSHHDALSTSGLGSIAFNRGSAQLSAIGGACDGATDSGNLKFYTTASGGSITERMRIDSSGNLIKVGGVIKGERGTASAPAYSFSDDTDTGMFNDANQHLGFSVGGSERMSIDSSGNLKFNSGYGSAATAYGCRAWVNFNGTGTVAIRASGNVSSITDSSTGNYQVNFTTAMPDANYVTNVTPLNTVSSDYGSVAAVATSSVSVVTFQNSGSAVDVVGVYVTVLR